ncbi:MAG: 50S ribosomal protein L4 [Candidatus Bathyarchaeia archaeon]
MSGRSVEVYGLEGTPKGKVELPKVFESTYRPDVIRKAVVALQTHRLQPKGRDPMAGKRTTAESFGVGRDLARVPRVKGERHPRAGSAAFAPSTVGGRLAHPPRVEKKIWRGLNRREARLALASAVAATAMKEIVESRGHKVENIPSIPLIVEDGLQEVSETKEAREILRRLGLWSDVERVLRRVKRRSGKACSRGRGLKIAKGPLIVYGEDKGVVRAFRNIPGIDLRKASDLNVEDLAPGTHPGRLTVWTESALKILNGRFTGGG